MAVDNDDPSPLVCSPGMPQRAGSKLPSWDEPLDYEAALYRNRARTELKLDLRQASMFPSVQAAPGLLPATAKGGLQVRSLPQLRRPPSRLLPAAIQPQRSTSMPYLRPSKLEAAAPTHVSSNRKAEMKKSLFTPRSPPSVVQERRGTQALAGASVTAPASKQSLKLPSRPGLYWLLGGWIGWSGSWLPSVPLVDADD